MKAYLLISSALLLGSCSAVKSVFAPTPEQQLSRLVEAHPELVAVDTVTVRDTITVARVEVQTKYVAVPDVARIQRDSLLLDSLLSKLSASLDSVQRHATQASVHQLLRQRPYFPDTLCFDTLGVHGRIWQRGNVYQIQLVRDEIRTPHQAKAVVSKLKPCDCKTIIWYDPRT